jgi:dihydroxyacetone kinase
VIVADDIALPDNKQPRGIAGTALVHKIAGYAAEQGNIPAFLRKQAD